MQKSIKTDEIQTVSAEESAKHENKVQLSWKHLCPDELTLAARVNQYKHCWPFGSRLDVNERRKERRVISHS